MEIELNESFVDVFHGGDEGRSEVMGCVDEDFVSDGDGFDLGVGEVGGDVSLDPGGGVGGGFGYVRELLVWEIYGEFDAGIG